MATVELNLRTKNTKTLRLLPLANSKDINKMTAGFNLGTKKHKLIKIHAVILLWRPSKIFFLQLKYSDN